MLAQPFPLCLGRRPSPSMDFWTLLAPMAQFLWRSYCLSLRVWASLVALSHCCPEWPWGWQTNRLPTWTTFYVVMVRFTILFRRLGGQQGHLTHCVREQEFCQPPPQLRVHYRVRGLQDLGLGPAWILCRPPVVPCGVLYGIYFPLLPAPQWSRSSSAVASSCD